MAKRRKNGLFTPRETYRVTRAPGRANETTYKGYKLWQTWPEGFKTSADPESTFDTLKDVKRFIDWQRKNPGKPVSAFVRRLIGAAGRKRGNPAYQIGDAEGHILSGHETHAEAVKEARSLASAGKRVEVVWRGQDGDFRSTWFGKSKRNPSDATAEVYEEFHGRPSSEVVTVTEKIYFPDKLAALGDLRTLVVKRRDGVKVTLTRFKKAILCTNKEKNQMYVRGGDQSVDLGAFGIRNAHEVETLGKVVELVYFTTKDHLGDEGGTALYFHVIGETNENGKRKMAGWAPDLIYHTVDERMEFSGGSYSIKAEGVDK